MYFEKNIKNNQLTCCLNEKDTEVLLILLESYISYLESSRLKILYPDVFDFLLNMKKCIDFNLEFKY